MTLHGKKYLLFFAKILFLIGVGLLISEFLFRLVPLPETPRFDRPTFVIGFPTSGPFRESLELPPRRPSTFRIITIGDSFTWGANVPLDYTYPKHLESLLNLAGTRTYEVYNLGRNGASLKDILKLLPNLTDLHPDLVIYGYYLNDPEQRLGLPLEIQPLFEAMNNPPRWSRWLEHYSRLYRYLHFKFFSWRLTQAQVHYFHRIFNIHGPIWARHRKEIHELSLLSEQLGFPIIVVIWPHLGLPMDHRYPFQQIHHSLAIAFNEEHIPYLDLFSAFKNLDFSRLQAIPAYDPHPSEIAHRIAAESIMDWLRTSFPVIHSDIQEARLIPNPPIPSVRLRLAPLVPVRTSK